MERRNTIHNISDIIDISSDEVTEEASFEANVTNLQDDPFDNVNVRKRGLEQVGKFLPPLTTQPQHNNQSNNSARNSELPKLLKEFKGSKFTASCPICSQYLKYSYISSPRNLVDINAGRDSSHKKLRNLMPPYCNKCHAHLLFDQNETKNRMIENVERWLEINLDEETKGKIIFICASPTGADGETSPRVMIELTPKGPKRCSVSFSFNDADVDPHMTTSSLTEALGQFHSMESEPQRNGCFDHHPGQGLFSSDSNGTLATDDFISHDHNSIQIVSTESEEREILQRYSITKALATDAITKHLKMRYELTSDLCDRCQMPMMKMGDSVVYCIVCPTIDKEAKRISKEKRKKMQKLYIQNMPTSHYAPASSSETQTSQESEAVPRERNETPEQRNARLTALEEGLGFIYSPRNQVNVIDISRCMTNDDHEPTTSGNTKNNTSAVCKSQSSDQASVSSKQQQQQHELLQQLPYYDHVNNQYSVGIEYTYSIHQQNVSQQCTIDDCSSESNSFESNIIFQTSTVSETQCPRDLPPNEMIWSPVNNTNNTSLQFSFSETSNGQHGMKVIGDNRYFVGAVNNDIGNEFSASNEEGEASYNSVSIPLPEYTKKSDMNETSTKEERINERCFQVTTRGNEETIATRIARLSNAMRKFTEETRDDVPVTVSDESDLHKNQQLSFEGPLLTPQMFNLPGHNVKGGQETGQGHNAQSSERESIKTVRVFGKTMLRSPRSQHEILPPLFPSPIASPQADRTEKNLGKNQGLKAKEVVLSQTSLLSIEEKTSALFPPPEHSPYCTAATTRTQNGASSSSLHVGEGKKEQSDPLCDRASSSKHIDYIQEISLKSNQSCFLVPAADAPPPIEYSSKVMDPPGKRLTKRCVSDPVDPPAFVQPTESSDTPKRNNRRTKAEIDTLKTTRQNNFGRQSCCTLPILTPKPTNYAISTRQCRESPFLNVDSSKQNSKGCGSTYRKRSKIGDVSHHTSTAEKNVLLTIPSWVDDEIVNSTLKSAISFGDSSIDKLIQQINDIEADFGTIMASIPGSSESICTLETMESVGDRKPSVYNNKNQHGQQKKEESSPIASIEIKKDTNENKLDSFQSSGKQNSGESQAVSSADSYDSDVTDDIVLENLSNKLRSVYDQIEKIESRDDTDEGECIGPADSHEEMLQLINRLNYAAESLRTFADFQD
jgi:uncharacterized Zn finger protein (UPF0148 family)